MSYRNPRQTIDNRLGKISKGIDKWYQGRLKDRNTYEAAEQKDNKELAAKIKSNWKPDAKYNTAYLKAKAAGDKFTSKLYDTEGERAKGAPKIKEQINEILANIGTELNEKLKEPGLDEMHINTLKNDAIANMNNFTTQMANWQLGMDEFLLARAQGGKVGSLLADETGHRNPKLIEMFQDITDQKESNIWMTWNGTDLNFVEGKFDKNNEFQVKDHVDFTAVIGDKDRFGDGQFFLHNQAFDDDVEFAGFDKVIQEDLAGNTDLMVGDKLDYTKVKNYFLENEAGQGIMKTFIDEENEGKTKWSDLGGEGVYSDENYIAAVLKRGLIKNGLTPPVVEEEDTTTTNTASTTTGGGTSNFLPSNNQTTTTPATTTTTTTTEEESEDGVVDQASSIIEMETSFGGPPDKNGVATPLASYKGKEDEADRYLNSKEQVRKDDYYASDENKSAKKKKRGLKIDIGADVYDNLSQAEQLILRTEHFNLRWDPRVLLLQTAGMLGHYERKDLHNDAKLLDKQWATIDKKKLVEALKGKDQEMLDNFASIMSGTSGNNQDQYNKRIAYLAKKLGLKDSYQSKKKNTNASQFNKKP